MPAYQLPRAPASRRRDVICAIGVVVALAVAGGVTLPGRPPRVDAAPDSVVVLLRSGAITLSPVTTARFLDALRQPGSTGLHGLAAFRRHPTAADRRLLEAGGLTVSSPLRGRVYRVRVRPGLRADDQMIWSRLLWLAGLRPQDRVAPDVLAEARRERRLATSGDRARSDGLLPLVIAFHDGVSDAEVARLLGAHTRDPVPIGERHWRVRVPRSHVPLLSRADGIRWIDLSPAPTTVDNDKTRGALAVEPVQDFSILVGRPAGLGGAGVRVGIFDIGVDGGHDDFRISMPGFAATSRVVVDDAAASWHGTLVASVIAGSGQRSAGTDSWGIANGGTPYQWRGMAPQAELLDVQYEPLFGNLELTASTIRTMIVDHGMDISNHSYELERRGKYTHVSAQHDAMIRGDALAGTLTIPPRLQVFSAGNWGGAPSTNATTTDHGYFSLNKELKNALLVGSWSVSLKRIVGSSSLGPTHDGRLKPDVVAPGSQVRAAAYWQPGSPSLLCTQPPEGTTEAGTIRQQFYGTECGTSLAAAAVTGVLALVLEQYAATYAIALDKEPPLPSTLRGILVHSATDVVDDAVWFTNVDGPVRAYEGPDFATGYGLVDAGAAVAVVRQRLIRESRIDSTCDVRSFAFFAGEEIGGETSPVRVTLAWDDPASEPALSVTTPRLRNDLDLVLVDPAGARHYPWQRNQRITNANGDALTPEQQTCGTDIVVERLLTPPGPVPAADLEAASSGRGPDHLNNVEQVVAAGTPGLWRAEVTGFDVGLGPQRFSLIGVPAHSFLLSEPLKVCELLPGVCDRAILDLCRRYPRLCAEPRIVPIGPRGLQVMFRSIDDRVILPMRRLCTQLEVPGRCAPSAGGSTYRFRIGTTAVPIGVVILSGSGERVAGTDAPTRTAQLTLRVAEREEYFLVLSASARTVIGRAYDVPISVRAIR